MEIKKIQWLESVQKIAKLKVKIAIIRLNVLNG